MIDINDEHVDNADHLDIIMPMYNLIECSDNYSDTSGTFLQFKRDKQNMNNGNPGKLLQLIHHPLNTNQVFLNL